MRAVAVPGKAVDAISGRTSRLIERVGYLTDLLSDKAIEIIGRRHAKPFFISLQYTAPHAPWEGPEDEAIGHTAHGPGPMTAGGSLKIYAAMMKRMDAGIGRVLNALERAKIDRDTLVIFTSDNGGERYSYNWPFSFQKMYLNEGGTRVPAIVAMARRHSSRAASPIKPRSPWTGPQQFSASQAPLPIRRFLSMART